MSSELEKNASQASLNVVSSTTDILNEHFHSICKVYPTLIAGKSVVTGSTAWELGEYTLFVGSGIINSDYDLHFIAVETLPTNGTYELVFYSGEANLNAECARARFNRINNNEVTTNLYVQSPIIKAGTILNARMAGSPAATVSGTLSIQYHTY